MLKEVGHGLPQGGTVRWSNAPLGAPPPELGLDREDIGAGVTIRREQPIECEALYAIRRGLDWIDAGLRRTLRSGRLMRRRCPEGNQPARKPLAARL
jgi:hypothetical protein